MPPNLAKIKEAIDNIQALYALMLGAKKEREDLETDVNQKIQQAKAAYESMVSNEMGRLNAAQRKIDEADRAVGEAQDQAFQELGIVVRLEPERSGGGHTRL